MPRDRPSAARRSNGAHLPSSKYGTSPCCGNGQFSPRQPAQCFLVLPHIPVHLRRRTANVPAEFVNDATVTPLVLGPAQNRSGPRVRPPSSLSGAERSCSEIVSDVVIRTILLVKPSLNQLARSIPATIRLGELEGARPVCLAILTGGANEAVDLPSSQITHKSPFGLADPVPCGMRLFERSVMAMTFFLFGRPSSNTSSGWYKHCPHAGTLVIQDPSGLPRLGRDQKAIRVLQAIDDHWACRQLK